MMTTSLLGAITATALLAGPAPALPSAEPIDSGATGVTVESDAKVLPHFWAIESFGKLQCPDHAPYLDNREYTPYTWNGVEFRGGEDVQWAALRFDDPDTTRPRGVLSATASNWTFPSAARTAQVVLHCTA